jgi:ABC-type uncharacterized transport system ATPase subunit
MKLAAAFFVMLLFVVPLTLAQQPAPTAPPVATTQVGNIDPTQDTNDPTLLSAQIMILDNAQEASRGKLSQLKDFQDYEKFGALSEAKRQKLQGVMQQQMMQQRNADIQAKTARQHDGDTVKAEAEAIAKANDAKKAAAAKAAADAAAKPK